MRWKLKVYFNQSPLPKGLGGWEGSLQSPGREMFLLSFCGATIAFGVYTCTAGDAPETIDRRHTSSIRARNYRVAGMYEERMYPGGLQSERLFRNARICPEILGSQMSEMSTWQFFIIDFDHVLFLMPMCPSSERYRSEGYNGLRALPLW
jgi:hypothetical protein